MRVLLLNHFPMVEFWIRLDNENLILCYVSGRIRCTFFIRIQHENRVKMEAGRYDSTGGRIIYRLRNKDSND
uniref:translation initiation factor 1 n=1 Tax=Berchemia polyphylla TaxID=1082498 RepID=UPI0023D82056|nr:translation initiation factor 1 [Berchemia polyphylla]WDE24713.1 translation initiation factor 1 [Berchemia polyphylla]